MRPRNKKTCAHALHIARLLGCVCLCTRSASVEASKLRSQIACIVNDSSCYGNACDKDHCRQLVTCADGTQCSRMCCMCTSSCVDAAWPGALEQWRLIHQALLGAGIDQGTAPAHNSLQSLVDYLGTRRFTGVYHASSHPDYEPDGKPVHCGFNFRGVRLVYVPIYKDNTHGFCANLAALHDGSKTSRTFQFALVRALGPICLRLLGGELPEHQRP